LIEKERKQLLPLFKFDILFIDYLTIISST